MDTWCFAHTDNETHKIVIKKQAESELGVSADDFSGMRREVGPPSLQQASLPGLKRHFLSSTATQNEHCARRCSYHGDNLATSSVVLSTFCVFGFGSLVAKPQIRSDQKSVLKKDVKFDV
jgi:hypothetical protein